MLGSDKRSKLGDELGTAPRFLSREQELKELRGRIMDRTEDGDPEPGIARALSGHPGQSLQGTRSAQLTQCESELKLDPQVRIRCHG